MISVDDDIMGVRIRKLLDENWEPWIDEGYSRASSNMMVPKIEAGAYSCRVIHLEPGGHTGMHGHERVHHVMMIKGEAVLETDTEKVTLDNMKAVMIEANIPHRFVNTSRDVALIQVQNIFPR